MNRPYLGSSYGEISACIALSGDGIPQKKERRAESMLELLALFPPMMDPWEFGVPPFGAP